MTIRLILLAIFAATLSGCQTIPAERHTNCACAWESVQGNDEGAVV